MNVKGLLFLAMIDILIVDQQSTKNNWKRQIEYI